ncbi:MAG TPA: hypothetical protein VHV78_08175, partial [Gemmatimonadaceae bacterium]|nr:hypothetical protein [Gemmatimonadaceae bacterium]
SPAMRAVRDRRRSRPSAFINDSLLRGAGRVPLSEALRGHVPGFVIQPGGTGLHLVSVRDQRTDAATASASVSTDAGRQACFANVYVDGVMVFSLNPDDPREPPSLNDYTADQMAAVEFYPPGMPAPPQFKSGPCGVVLLWTAEQ